MAMGAREGQYLEILMSIRYYLVENGFMEPGDDFNKMPDIVENLIFGEEEESSDEPQD
jgi:hypothetical protein